ncbi:MAG: NAD(P)-binding domain-containing protein [Anaerolineae bacterium]
MTVIYHEEDGDLGVLAGKQVGIIGYGNMGRPVALNLRDSGVQVLVSEPRLEKQAEAIAEGFAITEIEAVVRGADVIMPLLRDEAMPKIYLEHVSPYLRRGQALVFSSAYNLTYGFIEAPPFVDGAGLGADAGRSRARKPFPAKATPASLPSLKTPVVTPGMCWGLAKAMGALKGGAIEIRFEQETELDLFLQQRSCRSFTTP